MPMVKNLVTQENTKCDAFDEKCIEIVFGQTIIFFELSSSQDTRLSVIATDASYRQNFTAADNTRSTQMSTINNIINMIVSVVTQTHHNNDVYVVSCGFMGQTYTYTNTYRIDLHEDKGLGTLLEIA